MLKKLDGWENTRHNPAARNAPANILTSVKAIAKIKDIREIEQEAMNALMSYDWPGNVRELENVIERAVILCVSDIINVECLPRKMNISAQDEYPPLMGLNLPELEKRTIIRALDKTSWNQSKAAGLLGITRKQLRTKMKNHSLFPEVG